MSDDKGEPGKAQDTLIGERILDYMHEHNNTMCAGFKIQADRQEIIEKNNVETSNNLKIAAKVLAGTQKWMQGEMTAQREANEKLQWKLVGALVLTLSGITGALVFLVKVGFL